MTTYSDDILLAYLRGDVPDDVGAGIEDAVVADADLEARLMSLDPFAPIVAQAFATAPDEARLDGAKTVLAKSPQHNRSVLRSVLTGLAVAAAGVMGFFVATTTLTPPTPELTWRQQAALYQALYVPETVASIEVTDAALSGQFARAETALARRLDQAGLRGLSQMDLKRTQVLAFKNKPLVQIAYAGPDGTPFALCIFRRGGDKPDAAVSTGALAGMAVANWAQGDYAYMLIGGTDEAFVSQVAAEMVDVL